MKLIMEQNVGPNTRLIMGPNVGPYTRLIMGPNVRPYTRLIMGPNKEKNKSLTLVWPSLQTMQVLQSYRWDPMWDQRYLYKRDQIKRQKIKSKFLH